MTSCTVVECFFCFQPFKRSLNWPRTNDLITPPNLSGTITCNSANTIGVKKTMRLSRHGFKMKLPLSKKFLEFCRLADIKLALHMTTTVVATNPALSALLQSTPTTVFAFRRGTRTLSEQSSSAFLSSTFSTWVLGRQHLVVSVEAGVEIHFA